MRGIMIQGVIFDMDGTLFGTESIFQQEWNRIAHEMGFTLPDGFKYEICGTSGEAMNRVIEKFYHVENGAHIQALCKKRVADHLKKEVPEKPGCREIIEFLKGKGYRLSIGSSSPVPLIRSNLEKTGLLPFFDSLTGGEEVKRGKPAPDIFLLAAEKLGVSPENCYVFEDSPNGIRAAFEAGMKPILVPDLMPVTDEMKEKALRIFDTLLDAKEWMERQ